MHALRFGLFPFRSPLLWKSHVVFSSSGYLDVSVHRVPDVWLCIHHTTTEVCSARFPHSEISGSKDICSSPKLFAAYHVFHRLLVPRHPPCALSSLTNFYHSHSVVSVGLGFFVFTKFGSLLNLVFSRMSCIFCVKDIVSISVCNFQGT